MQSIAYSSLSDLAGWLADGSLSSEQLTRACLDRIARLDGKAGAFVEVYEEAAMLQARAADLESAAGLRRSALHGIPVAFKDLCEIEGRVTTGGSAVWRDRRSQVTATVVERLRSAGMVVLGKTHTVEFALGGWGTNEHMGCPRNPWSWSDKHRVPGGSSSGSGVAVAAGMVPVAIGTDTGGSIRIPSSMNGLTGLKPTFGRISLHGVLPLSRTFDSVGPMTRSARDAAMVYDLMAGRDSRDVRTFAQPEIDGAFVRPVHGLRIGRMSPEQYPPGIASEVVAAVEAAVEVFASLGARIEIVKLPFDFRELARVLGTLITAQVYREHAHHIEDPALPFGGPIRERVLSGREISAEAYLRGMEQRSAAIRLFREALSGFDLLLTPTLPFGAPCLDEIDERNTAVATFTRPINYLEGCAITLPCGLDGNGMPVGVQLIAGPWQESLLLATGERFQDATDWHTRTPPALD